LEPVKVPKKIKNCPIIEVIVELKFKSLVPDDMVGGIIFKEFIKEFPKSEKLPAAEFPQMFRESDENLKYSPHFRFTGEKFILLFGPKSFGLVCPKEYVGWAEFDKKIEQTFKKFFGTGIVKESERIGLRYINFFKDINIFEKIKFDFDTFKSFNNVFRTEYKQGDHRIVLQLANEALLANKEKGSTFDVDVIFEKSGNISNNNFSEIVRTSHGVAKNKFFGLLKDEYIKTLDPVY
jgi:uncharacterized protein (TIGR04255 family)